MRAQTIVNAFRAKAPASPVSWTQAFAPEIEDYAQRLACGQRCARSPGLRRRLTNCGAEDPDDASRVADRNLEVALLVSSASTAVSPAQTAASAW